MQGNRSQAIRSTALILTALCLGTAGCKTVLDDTPDSGPGSAGSTGGAGTSSVVTRVPDGGVIAQPPDGATCSGFNEMPVPFMGKAAIPPTLLSGAVQADVPPPAISGGTLLLTNDKKTLVAADPDRDRVYLVDVATQKLRATVLLHAADEPGRLVQDGAGIVHVALRNGGSIASIDVAAGTLLSRTPVCDLPRGIAYDAAADALHVACADGKLVTLPASLGAVTRTVDLGRDLRDVLVQSGQLFVTRFRSAELLRLDPSGAVEHTFVPAKSSAMQTEISQVNCMMTKQEVNVEHTPSVVYRALSVPGHGVMMLHQRSRTTEVSPSPGGYGGSGCGSTIVQTVLTSNADSDGQGPAPEIDSMTLPVDMAVDSKADVIAMVAAGNWGTGAPQVTLYGLSSSGLNMMIGGDAGTLMPTPIAPGSCAFPSQQFDPEGQATAVSFVNDHLLAVQTREPATIAFFDTTPGGAQEVKLDLGQASRADTGHTMFHSRTSAGIACASCHAEASDDGHVWSFAGIGARRTQQLRGGILGTEPFHWNGDMKDFGTLMQEVFVGRMSGFTPAPDQQNALSHWVDRQPSLHATPADLAAVKRGQALFSSTKLGCTSCHAGTRFTNNATVDVGTGHALQVPSLHGVSFRAPFLHNGCAPTLTDRFGSCGGGDKHGHTSDLTKAQIGDLVSYLESL